MKKDIQSREDLYTLVAAFYEQIKQDEEIGPVFHKIISDWESHLQRITDFWEQHLFGIQKYRGNPIEVHNEVDRKMNYRISARDFGTWLFYWMKTINDLYEGKNAELLKFKARKMQTVFFVNMHEHKPKTV